MPLLNRGVCVMLHMHGKCNPEDCFLKDVLIEMLNHAKKRTHDPGMHGIVLSQMNRSYKL